MTKLARRHPAVRPGLIAKLINNRDHSAELSINWTNEEAANALRYLKKTSFSSLIVRSFATDSTD